MSCTSTTISPAHPLSLPIAGMARPGFLEDWRETVRSLIQRVARSYARRRQRFDLMELDDHLLADIGLSRDAARREAQKPFWQ